MCSVVNAEGDMLGMLEQADAMTDKAAGYRRAWQTPLSRLKLPAEAWQAVGPRVLTCEGKCDVRSARSNSDVVLPQRWHARGMPADRAAVNSTRCVTRPRQG